MRNKELYWKCIAADIAKEDKIKKGHPSTWKKGDVLTFLSYFEERLETKCEKNNQIAARLGFSKSKENGYQISVLGFDAFRKIFITKESDSTSKTQNQFAVYLGHYSKESYIENKGINLEKKLPPIPKYLYNNFPKTPYLGLKSYTIEDSNLFHGRKDELYLLLKYLEEEPEPCDDVKDYKDLLFLTGQTGVGKSSLLHAGLIPRLFEKWDIYYARRMQDIGLPKQFRKALELKPYLLIINQADQVFRNDEVDAKSVFEAFAEELSSIWNRFLEYPITVLIACKKVYLNKVEKLLQNSTVSNDLVVLKPHDNTENLTLIDDVLNSTLPPQSKLILIASEDERHNLWKEISPVLGVNWVLKYKNLSTNDSLVDLLISLKQPRKKLIILDQVEEAITKPNIDFVLDSSLMGESSEVAVLSQEVHAFLKKNKNSKIILSYRADFGEQIEDDFKGLLTNQYIKWLIKPLDKNGVVDAIKGPLEKDYFKLTYYDGFLEQMAYELKKDENSNIAPALQILLKELWEECQEDRHISEKLFNRKIGKRVGILETFLRQQLKKLSSELGNSEGDDNSVD